MIHYAGNKPYRCGEIGCDRRCQSENAMRGHLTDIHLAPVNDDFKSKCAVCGTLYNYSKAAQRCAASHNE